MMNGSPRTPKTSEQLLQHARDQLGFLIASAVRYDDGHVAEAKRLATTMRVLLHHTDSSSALLVQTGHRDRLQYLDTAGDPEPGLVTTELRLITARSDFRVDEAGVGRAIGTYRPRYGKIRTAPLVPLHEQLEALRQGTRPRRRPGTHERFEDWWSQIVLSDNEGNDFSRGRLVKALANEEGGAHVDPRTRADYKAVANSNSLGWIASGSWDDGSGVSVEGRSPAESPIPACVRQIAWELHTTIRNQAPELMPT